MTLWTQGELTAARRVYQQAGFVCVKRVAQRSFGAERTAETWERDALIAAAAVVLWSAVNAAQPSPLTIDVDARSVQPGELVVLTIDRAAGRATASAFTPSTARSQAFGLGPGKVGSAGRNRPRRQAWHEGRHRRSRRRARDARAHREAQDVPDAGG